MNRAAQITKTLLELSEDIETRLPGLRARYGQNYSDEDIRAIAEADPTKDTSCEYTTWLLEMRRSEQWTGVGSGDITEMRKLLERFIKNKSKKRFAQVGGKKDITQYATVAELKSHVEAAEAWDDATADAGGRFKLQFPPKATAAPQVDVPHIIVRDRQRNLAAAIDMDTIATDPLTIKLASGMILSGKVTDEQRKGIPGTVLSLTFVSDRMWHRLKEEAAKCDPNGRYEIRAVPSDHSYTVDARAEGYGFDHTDPVVADPANNRIELNPIVLRVANLDVSGVVVDGNDRPIPKASVFSSGRGQAPTNVTTDAQGRFTIHGVCAGAIEIRAGSADRGPQYYGPVQATGGATDVKVVIGGPRRN